jgi:hypothetical protein
MEDFHCDHLDFSFRVKAEDVDRAALLKETGLLDEEDLRIALVFASKENPDKEHSHIDLRFRPDNQVRIQIAYHNSPGDTEDTRPPYMEECAKWLSGFVRQAEVEAYLNASYVFGAEFSPRVSLQFPLVSSEDFLKGSLVEGIALKLPEGRVIENAFIQSSEDVTGLSIYRQLQVNLKDFDLYAELESLSVPVLSFFRVQEKRDEDGA